MRFIVFIFALLGVVVRVQSGIPCYQYCQTVGCDPYVASNCKDGILVDKASKCSCCTLCIKLLKEGDQCTTQLVGEDPTSRCGPGLECVAPIGSKFPYTCQKMTTRICTQDRQVYDDNRQNLNLMLPGLPRPNCEDNGDYAPKQCLASSCYCVTVEGKRIFGEQPVDSKQPMNCACSRALDQMGQIDDIVLSNIDNQTLQYEQILAADRPSDVLCASNGDWNKLLCTNGLCSCIDVEKLEMVGSFASESLVDADLTKCNNTKILNRNCSVERAKLLTEQNHWKNQNVLPLGINLPQCDWDGTYNATQCTATECNCVEKNGEIIKGFTISRFSSQYDDMHCNCARELSSLRRQSLNKELVCKTNGNYDPIQCFGSICYCVDTTYGLQNKDKLREVSREDRHTLINFC